MPLKGIQKVFINLKDKYKKSIMEEKEKKMLWDKIKKKMKDYSISNNE